MHVVKVILWLEDRNSYIDDHMRVWESSDKWGWYNFNGVYIRPEYLHTIGKDCKDKDLVVVFQEVDSSEHFITKQFSGKICNTNMLLEAFLR